MKAELVPGLCDHSLDKVRPSWVSPNCHATGVGAIFPFVSRTFLRMCGLQAVYKPLAMTKQQTQRSDSVLESSKHTHMTQSSIMCLQILRRMAQRMQLRHPNLATVLGVSCEAVTGDPLLVRLHASLAQQSCTAAHRSNAFCR